MEAIGWFIGYLIGDHAVVSIEIGTPVIVNLHWLVPMAWYHLFREQMTMTLRYPQQP